MYKKKKILAIIPARAGSKRIKNKNIINLNGRPLINYTIVEAKKSKYIDNICLSTDSKKIQAIAKKSKLKSFFLRPKKLSRDSTLTIDVVLHALNKSEKYLKKTFDFVILLQPTSPLRNAKDIDVAIKKIVNGNKNSLISVCDVEGNHPNRMKIIKKNILINYVNLDSEDMRPRQKLKKVYIRNGAIYITNRNFLKKNMKIADRVSIPYVMSADRSVNIDTPIDVTIAKNFLASKL